MNAAEHSINSAGGTSIDGADRQEPVCCQIDTIFWEQLVNRSLDCDSYGIKDSLEALYLNSWSKKISREEFNEAVSDMIADQEQRVENMQLTLEGLRESYPEE